MNRYGKGQGWAEIERSRFGYWISAGDGPGVYQVHWFRFRYKAARRKAQRLIDQVNQEHRRHEQRERLGYEIKAPGGEPGAESA